MTGRYPNRTPLSKSFLHGTWSFMNGRKSGNGLSSMPGTGEALRLARLTHRLTQREVGDSIGMTSAAVAYYENTGAVPDVVIAKLPKTVRAAVAEASLKGHEAAMAAMRRLLTKTR
jgi:hypothetical protein